MPPVMERDPELELLDRARSGDERALDRLLANHERQLYRFGLRMCGSEEAARDVLQQTLLTAFRGIRGFRGEASLSTWLYQIARSFCLKSRRLRGGEPATFEPLEAAARLPGAEASPEAAAHAKQLGQALQAAISALPETAREVLVLRDVEGLSAEEAAEVLGLQVPALKSRLHRARMEVRRNLSALLEEPERGAGCPELSDALLDYAAEEIDQAACARIERHLQECPRCQRACESLKRTVSLCRSLPGGEVPAPVRAAVRQALRSLASSDPPSPL